MFSENFRKNKYFSETGSELRLDSNTKLEERSLTQNSLSV